MGTGNPRNTVEWLRGVLSLALAMACGAACAQSSRPLPDSLEPASISGSGPAGTQDTVSHPDGIDGFRAPATLPGDAGLTAANLPTATPQIYVPLDPAASPSPQSSTSLSMTPQTSTSGSDPIDSIFATPALPSEQVDSIFATPARPRHTGFAGLGLGEHKFSILDDDRRQLFESDWAFEDFIQPITNPINAKDPRSLTELRFLFINNWGRTNTPVLGGGNFQVYALQARLALTERLTLFADKDGYTVVNPVGSPGFEGWNNLNAGLKYTLIRDVENQFLFTGGFQYEAPSGEADVFQNHGSGILTLFGVAGKEFGDGYHALLNFGNAIPLHPSNSGYFFTSLHFDKQIDGWFYPLFELNWFHYNESGTFLPPIGVEGDGLINFGTEDVVGHNLVFGAAGFRAKLTRRAILGVAYEFPLTSREDLLGNRVTVDFILRY